MIRFDSDYMEGAHPAVMEALMLANTVQTPGYGEDPFCARAAARIRENALCPTPPCIFSWAVPRPTAR